jgi:hypothetical protein
LGMLHSWFADLNPSSTIKNQTVLFIAMVPVCIPSCP